MSYQKKSLQLFYTKGTTDKEYVVVIEADPSGRGYQVFGLNGRRGRATTRQAKTSAPVALGTAEALFQSLVDAKEKKGYTSALSGMPFGGINLGAAVVTGTAPAPAAPPPALQPCTWLGTTGAPEVEMLLEDPRYVAQELVRGTRVFAYQDHCIVVDGGAPFRLPDAVVQELNALLWDFHVDGIFDADRNTLHLLDGYQDASLRFETRQELLGRALSAHPSLTPLHLAVVPVYREEEKQQLAWLVQDKGQEALLLRNLDSGYEPGMPARESAAVFRAFF